MYPLIYDVYTLDLEFNSKVYCIEFLLTKNMWTKKRSRLQNQVWQSSNLQTLLDQQLSTK